MSSSSDDNSKTKSSLDEKESNRVTKITQGEVLLEEIRASTIQLYEIYQKTDRRPWWWPILNFRLHLLNPVRDGFRILKRDLRERHENPSEFMLALLRVSLILADTRDISVLIRIHQSKLKVIQDHMEEIETAVKTICEGWEKVKRLLNWKAPVGIAEDEKKLIGMLREEVDEAFKKDWIFEGSKKKTKKRTTAKKSRSGTKRKATAT